MKSIRLKLLLVHAYLADVVGRYQNVSCSKVAVDKVLSRQILQPHSNLLRVVEQHHWHLRRDQLPWAVCVCIHVCQYTESEGDSASLCVLCV